MSNLHYNFSEFVDISELQKIYQDFSQTSGINIGIVNYPNNDTVLDRKKCDICEEFHCPNNVSINDCLKNHLLKDKSNKNLDDVTITICKTGLAWGYSPIKVNNQPIAAIVTSQVLFEEPDYELYKRNAEYNNYNIESYISALREVPVYNESIFRNAVKYITDISTEIACLNYKVNILKSNDRDLEKIEERIQKKISYLMDNKTFKMKDHNYKLHSNSCCYTCNQLLEGIGFFQISFDDNNKPTDYRILDINAAFEDLFDLKKEDIVGTSVIENLNNTSIPYIELFNNVINNKSKTIINTMMPQKGKFLEVTAILSLDDVIIVKVLDITDSKKLIDENEDLTQKSIDEMHKATSMLDKVLDIVFDSIVIFDNAGIIKYWNKASENLFGYKEEEVVGKNLVNFIIADEIMETFANAVKTSFTTYLEKSNEELFIDKNKNNIIVEFSISKFIHNDQNLNIAISRDITSKKVLESKLQEKDEILTAQNEELRAQEEELTAQNEELRSQEEELLSQNEELKAQEEELSSQNKELNRILDSLRKTQLFVDNSSVASYIVNEKGTIIYANKEGLNLLRVKEKEEVLNKKIFTFNDSFNESTWNEHLDALKRNKRLNFESTLITNNKKNIPVRISSNYFELDDKIFLFTYIIDITENKKLQYDLEMERNSLQAKVEDQTKVLKDYVKQLEEADKHKNMFLSNLSHELRTPLNSILGFSDMLLNGSFGVLNEKQLYYTKIISNNGLYLLDIISDLLDIAKIDTGKMTLNPEPSTPYKLINEVLESLEGDIIKKNLRVNTCFDRSIKDILLDKKRFKQIILNIVSNAIKYTNEGGNINIRQKQEDNIFMISVKDDGIGIPEDRIDLIFGEFYQINKDNIVNTDGLGIGLPLVKRLVKLHDGDITVKSRLNKGSTFYVTLPIIKAKINSLPEKVNSKDKVKSLTKNKRILVVEDNESNLSLILEVLSCYDHKISIARNGLEAIDMAESCNPDLILMDIRMPVMDGIEAASRIKAKPKFKDTPIVSLSASVDVDSIKKQKEAGFDYHISKPIRLNNLLHVLNTFLA